jgi:hypothetical protein
MQSDVPVWGDFQAILHLSIALNAVYAAAYEFIKDTIRQEAAGILAILESLTEVKERTPRVLNTKDKFRKLLCRINDIEMESTRFNNKALRPAAAVCVVIGTVELIYSCYNFHEAISLSASVLTCFLLFPVTFAIFAYTILYIYIIIDSRISRRQSLLKESS